MAQLGFGADEAVLSKTKDYLRLAATDKVIISPMFFRDYSCFENCGSCCNHSNISLEYILDSDRWRLFQTNHPEEAKLFYEVKDEESSTVVMRYRQEHAPIKTRCHFLNDNGRCSVHDSYPFPCNFAFSKFKDLTTSRNQARLTTEQYGRAWNFTRLDGTKGAMCGMLGFNYEKFLKDLQNLKELREYAIKLGIKTKLKYIIEYLDDNVQYFKTIAEGSDPNLKLTPVEFTEENVL